MHNYFDKSRDGINDFRRKFNDRVKAFFLIIYLMYMYDNLG